MPLVHDAVSLWLSWEINQGELHLLILGRTEEGEKMSDCSKNAFKVPEKPEIELSELTEDLRQRLDAYGIPWRDQSEESREMDYQYHMERTKVFLGDLEIASCIVGWTILKGQLMGITYGLPDRIEIMCHSWFGTDEPEPKTVDEIVEWLVCYLRKVD